MNRPRSLLPRITFIDLEYRKARGVFEDAARGPADLLRKADAALRRAKRLRGAE